MNTMNTQGFGDKEMFNDLLSTQKFVTSGYNTYTNECATPCIKSDFLNILNEEHQIQGEVFSEISKRGWYQVEAAEQNKIDQTKQQYRSASM